MKATATIYDNNDETAPTGQKQQSSLIATATMTLLQTCQSSPELFASR